MSASSWSGVYAQRLFGYSYRDAFLGRFEADSAGVYVRPADYKSRMRWIIPLVIALAVCFPLSPLNMC
jgi:hypothetical protein